MKHFVHAGWPGMVAAVGCLATSGAQAQLKIGEPGQVIFADGAFRAGEAPWFADGSGVVLVDLSSASDGSWLDLNSPALGQRPRGVYDCEKWVVVFKLTEMYVPSGLTVRFLNHDSMAPVVFLVEGEVTIEFGGTIDMSGEAGSRTNLVANPGPGGFRGGRAVTTMQGVAGLGPGGGQGSSGNCPESPNVQEDFAHGGSYASPAKGQAQYSVYGSDQILPLIGGSGGGSLRITNDPSFGSGGGAGGGAVLIASRISINLMGSIRASGGNGYDPALEGGWTGGGGSGGAIRLISAAITGNGKLIAAGGLGKDSACGQGARAIGGTSGGKGRIRLEALHGDISEGIDEQGSATHGDAGNPPVIWPEDLSAPTATLRIVSVNSTMSMAADCGETGTDPHASIVADETDFVSNAIGPATVVVEARNLAPEQWTVSVKVTGRNARVSHGAEAVLQPLSTPSKSLWATQIAFPDNTVHILQARAKRKLLE